MNMRITVHEQPAVITLRLEGSLAGPRVRGLDECLQTTLASVRKPTICVDLTGVTFIDDAGQECLAAMQRRGVEFIAPDALTKGIVAEITQKALSDSGPPM